MYCLILKLKINNITKRFMIFDIGGDPTFKNIIPNILKDINIILLIYDITSLILFYKTIIEI